MTDQNRTRTITWQDPMIVVDAAKTMSGLDRGAHHSGLRDPMESDPPASAALENGARMQCASASHRTGRPLDEGCAQRDKARTGHEADRAS